MLVMTRRVGETLNIGNDVVVKIVGVAGNKVRVGVSAPPEVSIERERPIRPLVCKEPEPQPA